MTISVKYLGKYFSKLNFKYKYGSFVLDTTFFSSLSIHDHKNPIFLLSWNDRKVRMWQLYLMDPQSWMFKEEMRILLGPIVFNTFCGRTDNGKWYWNQIEKNTKIFWKRNLRNSIVHFHREIVWKVLSEIFLTQSKIRFSSSRKCK